MPDNPKTRVQEMEALRAKLEATQEEADNLHTKISRLLEQSIAEDAAHAARRDKRRTAKR